MDIENNIVRLIEESISNNNIDYISIIKMAKDHKILKDDMLELYFILSLNKSFYMDNDISLSNYSFFNLNEKKAGELYFQNFLLHLNIFLKRKDYSYSDSINDLASKINDALSYNIILPGEFFQHPFIANNFEDWMFDFKKNNNNNFNKYLKNSIPKTLPEEPLFKI